MDVISIVINIFLLFIFVISKLSPQHVNPNATLRPGYLTVGVLPQRLFCLGTSLESKPGEKRLTGEKEAMNGGKPSTDSKKGHFGLQQSKSHPNAVSGTCEIEL